MAGEWIKRMETLVEMWKKQAETADKVIEAIKKEKTDKITKKKKKRVDEKRKTKFKLHFIVAFHLFCVRCQLQSPLLPTVR